MSLRFSLLGLIGLVSLSALACAALVQPGPGWLSVVVTLTAVAVGVQILRAVFAPNAVRAAAVGWLVFVVGYLAVALGPWLGQHVGPQLLSTEGLAYAQVNWRKEDPSAPVVQQQLGYNNNVWQTLLDGTSGTIQFNNGPWAIPLVVQPQATSVNCFQLSGHWLCAWLAGWLGAAVATHFQRHRHQPPTATT
jgi:hypothetical protein